MSYDLRQVPLFEGLPAADLERLSSGLGTCSLPAGEELFHEGDAGDMAYVITDGELEILKQSGGRDVRIAISSQGDVVGEMALLTSEPRSATARALQPVTLVSIPKSCLDEVLSTSAAANRALFDVFIQRWREQESRVRQSERMAQLGVLTAGLAHEMNNPAAAVRAGAGDIGGAIDRTLDLIGRLPAGLEPPAPSSGAVRLSSLERADIEEALEDELDPLGVSEPWAVAGRLADAGFRPGDLSGLPAEHAGDLVELAAMASDLRTLVAEISEGATRLSDLVLALKSYSFLDQAPVQNVDVAKGIEDTLLILSTKTKDLTITTDFAPDLPTITAQGSQLNQVWTNLIDNAADAIHDSGTSPGWIDISAKRHSDSVVVAVSNNGPSIPPAVIDRMFEAFYTTKEPGKGTGLGLDTAYRIVVTDHRGTIDVESENDTTVFTVQLPMELEAETQED